KEGKGVSRRRKAGPSDFLDSGFRRNDRATMKRLLVAFALGAAAFAAHAHALDTLREFVRDVKTGKADFTQTVTSPDGAKKKTSSGHFEFARPNRFRFA